MKVILWETWPRFFSDSIKKTNNLNQNHKWETAIVYGNLPLFYERNKTAWLHHCKDCFMVTKPFRSIINFLNTKLFITQWTQLLLKQHQQSQRLDLHISLPIDWSRNHRHISCNMPTTQSIGTHGEKRHWRRLRGKTNQSFFRLATALGKYLSTTNRFGQLIISHWCHVMEKESFENEDIAKLMNEMCKWNAMIPSLTLSSCKH